MNTPLKTPIYWSSPSAFVLAAAGAAIGLGSVWRLPALAGEYGGGAFFIVYTLALLGMCLPVLLAQLLLGRGVRGDITASLRGWAETSGQNRWWQGVAYLALLGALLVLSYYSVIAGWSIAYLVRSASGVLDKLSDESLRTSFLTLVSDPEKGLGWHTIFMVSAVICISHGVRRGLEPVSRAAIIAAAVALLLLLILVEGDGQLSQAFVYLLKPDFSALGWRGALEALHQAFFSLSLGVGVMIAFGSYLREETSLVQVGLCVLVLHIIFTLVCGLVVTAVLLSAGSQPSLDLKLIFETFPAAAQNGWVVTLFFSVLFLVTLTTAVGLMEPLVVWIMARFRISRIFAATSTGLVIWFLGLGTLLSFNLLADFTWLDRNVFEWMSHLSSRFILPLVGLLICVFVGRYLPPERLASAWSGTGSRRGFVLWSMALRYPARIGLILVLLYSAGVFTLLDQIW